MNPNIGTQGNIGSTLCPHSALQQKVVLLQVRFIQIPLFVHCSLATPAVYVPPSPITTYHQAL